MESIDFDSVKVRLAKDMDFSGMPFPSDPTNATNDWITLISFLGNYFLPAFIENINGQGVRDLISIWKYELGNMGGYITSKQGEVNLMRLLRLINWFKQPELKPEKDEDTLTQRQIYYKRFFGINYNDEESMAEVACCYLRIFFWNIKGVLIGPHSTPHFWKISRALPLPSLSFFWGLLLLILNSLSSTQEKTQNTLFPNQSGI